MALKPNRNVNPYGDDFYTFAAAAERGGIASSVTGPSTGNPGDPAKAAAYAADCTVAVPVGLLTQDVVAYDTNRVHENWYKSGYQNRPGMMFNVSRRGRWHTNFLKTGDAPSDGAAAYLYDNGQVSTSPTTRNSKTSPVVGTFRSSKDSAGFVLVDVQL